MIFLLEPRVLRSMFHLNQIVIRINCKHRPMFYLKKERRKKIRIIQRKIHSDGREKEKSRGMNREEEQLHKPRRHQRRKLADFQDIVS